MTDRHLLQRMATPDNTRLIQVTTQRWFQEQYRITNGGKKFTSSFSVNLVETLNLRNVNSFNVLSLHVNFIQNKMHSTNMQIINYIFLIFIPKLATDITHNSSLDLTTIQFINGFGN